MQVMHCWPTQWLEAAQRAGLVIYQGDGKWQFLNDGMRDVLAEFATDIVGHAITAERNECADFAEGATAYTQFQTIEHYKIASFIAAAIRERSNALANRRGAFAASVLSDGLCGNGNYNERTDK